VKEVVRLVTRQAGLREAWSLTRRRREAGISAAARPSVRGHESRTGLGEVGDERSRWVEDLGADRNAKLHCVSVGPVPALAAAVAAPSCADAPDSVERREVAQGRIGAHGHVPPAAPVASVRASARYVLLTAKAEAAVAAASGLDVDLSAV